jgi:Cas10/Cmr2, second palm domain
MYVDVGADRVQQYIGRTPRLKGQRGASAWLCWATSEEQVTRLLREDRNLAARRAELNGEAGQADSVISVRIPAVPADPADAQAAAAEVATALALHLRSVLPSVEISALWGTGGSYLEAYRDQMKPRREWPPLELTASRPGFPPLESCAECRADPVAGQVKIHENTLGVCLDCLARYQDLYRRPGLAGQPPRLPVYREEAALAQALGRDPVAGTAEDFTDLAALGGAETSRNHVATVYVDGNKIGDLFDRIAAFGRPGLKEQVSRAVSAATRASLLTATRAVTRDDPGEPLPVIPHVVGGDDLVVSVVADRAWRFTVSYLEAFDALVHDIPGLADVLAAGEEGDEPVSPSASAGLVFAHAKFPFRRSWDWPRNACARRKRSFTGPARRLPGWTSPGTESSRRAS